MVPLPDKLRPSLLTPTTLKTNSAGGGGLALSNRAVILAIAVSWLGAVAVFGSVTALGAAAVGVAASVVAGGVSVVGAGAAGSVSVVGLSATTG